MNKNKNNIENVSLTKVNTNAIQFVPTFYNNLLKYINNFTLKNIQCKKYIYKMKIYDTFNETYGYNISIFQLEVIGNR